METEKVKASPTKRFFVNSITRDIELKDAILDLLDNCVDGIARTLEKEKRESARPYEGFYANIELNKSEFSIDDNCGGIPVDVAINEAFRFGRSDQSRDSNLETVGMYGIGMKRAMFKMGTSISVNCQTEDEAYEVKVEPDWLKQDDNWELQLNFIERDQKRNNGTTIFIDQLHHDISEIFGSPKEFDRELRDEISQIFALIIRKGFEITVNGKSIKPVSFNLLSTEDLSSSKEGINTYQYTSVFNEVNIDVAIGFYRELASVDISESFDSSTRAHKNAGVTVICNDRIVVFRDKTWITGWGLKPVPSFHNQFIAIAGVVRFSSSYSENLPLTTTKRGLDISAEIYWHTLEFIKEGLKIFTDFTNKWKGNEKDTNLFFSAAKSRDSIEILNNKKNREFKKVPKSNYNEQRANPKLPQPKKKSSKNKIIYFREKEECKQVAEYLYGETSDYSLSELGNATFELALNEAKKAELK